MKGYQGLEALAALCGDQSKVAAATAVSSDAVGVNTKAPTSGATVTPTPTITSSIIASTPVAASIAATNAVTTISGPPAPNVITPVPVSDTSMIPATPPPMNMNMNLNMNLNNMMGQLTPQQIITAAATGVIDPTMAQSLLLGLQSNQQQQQQQHPVQAQAQAHPHQIQRAVTATTAPQAVPTGVPQDLSSATAATTNSSNNNVLMTNTMQQLAIQQYIQAQAQAAAKVQQQHQQQQQQHAQAAQAAAHAQAAAAAASAAVLSSHPQAALFAAMASFAQAGDINKYNNNKATATATGVQQQQHLLPSNGGTTTTPITTTATCSVPSTTATNGAGISDSTHRSSSPSQSKQQQQQQIKTRMVQPLNENQYQFQVPIASTSGFPSIMTKPTPSAAGSAHTHTQPIQQFSLPLTNPVTSNTGVVAAVAVANKNSSAPKLKGEKKQQKRAANRRSAQLSRKRKKLFIEEIKEENDDLRRKEQILKAIPDLVVVFDSSGKLSFVSESVGRFLDVCPDQLEGSSFWEMICEDSVRLLKAAFMDSLAAREQDSDTALLGAGVWELRLKDKDSNFKLVTLNGVVHFKGEAPEVVCCIRPLCEKSSSHSLKRRVRVPKQQQTIPVAVDGNGNNVDSVNGNKHHVAFLDGDASRISDGSNSTQQSVLSRHNDLSSQVQGEAASEAKTLHQKYRRMMHQNEADADNNNNSNNGGECDGTNNSVRISDGDSSDGLESDQSN
mmetsp:Transcript_59572/g.64301  ORF Transcript_59572/g.64301 Transcript_59572/m.64301 type:complete len:729 (-) Transcript_59572:246-2432(-)